MKDPTKPSAGVPQGLESPEAILGKAIRFLDLKITDRFPAYVCLANGRDYRVRPQEDGTLRLEQVDREQERLRFARDRDQGAAPFTFDLREFPTTRTIEFSYFPGMLAGYHSTLHVDDRGEMTRGRTVLS